MLPDVLQYKEYCLGGDVVEDRELLAQLPERLLAWYDAGARVLP